MKPLRTALFVPGNRPDRAEKAIGTAADAVIIDLEDAVPLAEKESTRVLVREVLDGHPGRRMFVRINALSTPYAKDDLAAIVSGNLEGIMLPKVESPDDIFTIDILLTELEEKHSMPPGKLEVMSICETARGLEELYPILSAKPAHNRVAVVTFGAADYTLDLGIALTREGKELEYPRARIPVACRSAGIMPPLDTPWMVDLKDIEGLIADAKKAKAHGFGGKLLIHPNQIEPCHDVFTPSQKEIDFAKKVIEVFEAAEKRGQAAIQLDGKFIDYPVLMQAKRISDLAESMAKK
jgi:citrate lyase subunit beta/citryl-CoA lyase